ncbi:uncharacterized protein BJ171DRAFT_576584 [Polychytrium aggregatum]|uniref:uncharacterized protein n=1 Tax=Polychytrium aggregatum TaxID=110093 RepID=UPI0022FEFF77|nr:uncharacterized protein BJ171DRAFT_576584 [Polychytrium aggregatum]KAI9209799.1 hypothetical protein BJ171DRAFT_576584 [Polychytrium aggregatum]
MAAAVSVATSASVAATTSKGYHDHFDEYKGRNLTQQEIQMLKNHQRQMEEHQGHEQQHAQMAFILITALITSQIAILSWKKFHPRSFNWATLIGLWIIPPLIGLRSGSYRYLFFWALYSVANSFIVKRAYESPLSSSTPGLVYNWYAWIYSISYAIGIFGYAIVAAAFFHIPALLFGVDIEGESLIVQRGIVLIFYGLYFGTLSRDFVERLSDRMATKIGYYNPKGIPHKQLHQDVCAICGESTGLLDSTAAATAARPRKGPIEIGASSLAEPNNPATIWAQLLRSGYRLGVGLLGDDGKLHKLTCDHTYHESCIRGWTIIGKKDCCPYCKEKVDLQDFSRNPWDTTQILYLNLLDALRYMVVWNPIILIIVHFIFNVFGYK